MVETCQIPNLDEIYAQHFDGPGRFVEVGAYDGFMYSNTYHLAQAGWEGLYIEPVLDFFLRCQHNHRDHNVRVLNAACSNYNGDIDLYQGPDIYSANGEMVKGKTVTVPCYMLDNVLFYMDWRERFELLVIDVEFHEKEVLQGFSLAKWKPKMVIIEAHESHENRAYALNADFINHFFRSYKKIYSDHINNIYVRD